MQPYFLYKGNHSNVAGPRFYDLHLLFDGPAKEVLDTVDPLAERQRILGAPAEYHLDRLRWLSAIGSETPTPENPRQMVEPLLDPHRAVLRDLRTGFGLAGRSGDPGSDDLRTRATLAHEKMEWFLRELLGSRSGPPEVLGGPAPVRAEVVARMGA